MRVWRTTFQILIAVTIVTVGFAGGPIAAAPLDQPACEALKTEQTTLAGAGVEADWQKGADWGKANAAPDRLKEIERYIAVTEQLNFRCRWVPASENAKRAGEVADKLAKNPDADPLAPPEPAAANAQGGTAQAPTDKTKDDAKPADASATAGAAMAAKLPKVTRLKKKKAAQKSKEAEKARTQNTGEAGDGSASDTTAAEEGEQPPVKKTAPTDDAYTPPHGVPQSTLTAPTAEQGKLPWADKVAPTPVLP